MNQTIHITVLIYLHEGQRATFERFEQAIKPTIEQYGGRFTMVGTPQLVSGIDSPPDEVHWLTFPSREAFDAYRAHVVSDELQSMRKQAVSRTLFLQTVPISYL